MCEFHPIRKVARPPQFVPVALLAALLLLIGLFASTPVASAQSDSDAQSPPLFLPLVIGGTGQTTAPVADATPVSAPVTNPDPVTAPVTNPAPVLAAAAGIGPGICSNDKTLACSTNADCGSGNTCYLPTAGGTTMSGQQCLAAASGIAGGCTANDVRLAQTTSLNIVKGCNFPGDTATISFVAQFHSTATSRYDVGVWISDNGGSALTGSSCTVANFPSAPTPPWLNLETGIGGNADNDICGDISSAADVFSSIQNVNVACIDNNGDGNLDIDTCLSWDNNATTKNGVACTSPIQATAGTTSKCTCQTLPGIAIPVPGVIKVDKITFNADGTPKPGDPTSFSFALTGGPNNINTPFSLKDADPLFNSGGLPLGQYAVAENVPNGWSLTGATCTSDQGRTQTPGNITLHSGETVTCTFNDKKTGAAPNLAVTKSNDANHDSTFSDVETVPANAVYPWTVTYQLTIVNNSATAGTISSISDDKTGTLTTPVSGKTPTCASLVGTTIGANATLTCYYDVTFANANTAQVINTATVLATNAFGTSTKSDTATVNFTANPALSLTKAATPATYGAVGDVINYTYVVKNTGNVTLAGPFTITDDKLGTVSCPAGALAPGASVTCTTTHTITQADLDAGSIVNKATASGNGVTSNEATATVTALQNQHLALTKSASPDKYDHVGQVINYTLVATNDGNVTLSGVSISDPMFSSLSCTPSQPATLAPGASLTCTGTHTVTQADLDAGHINNTATATGTPPSGPALSATASASVTAVQAGHLTLTKTANPTSYSKVGDVIQYTLVAKNDGNVTLTGVSISDPMFSSLSCTPSQPTTLAPGAKLTCTASHTVTQADLDAGSIKNTATATGKDPQNQTLSATDSATVDAAQAPHLSLTKSADLTTFSTVGQVIHYTLVATNDGNVTLSNVSISDPTLGALTCTQPVTLAPGASLTCTGSHTVTQADLNNGKVDNTATANGSGPLGQPVSDTASKSVPATQKPHLSLTKNASPKTYDHVGQVINYTLVATNDGNVTLTGVSISDPMFSSLSCTPTQPATLAPGASLTCTGTYAVTQADLDAGSIVNTANAAGASPIGPVSSLPATETVDAAQAPHLTLTKSASPATYDHVGQVVIYTLVATNDGNVTLNNVSISDPKLGALTCTPGQPTTLAPGGTLSCTGSYVITQADLDAGSVKNTATATGTGPLGQPAADTASTTVAAAQAPHLLLTKSADPVTYNSVGDVINYTLVAKNDGNVTLSGVSISDPMFASLSCTPAQPATLAPGASLTCTGTHSVTQADLDAGHISNTANAAGKDPQNQPVASPPASVTVDAVQNPHLTLTKSSTPASYSKVGDVINYTLVATNDGNVTLTSVSISDPMFPSLSCTPAQPATLAPGAALTCTASHTVTQADLDAGSILNTANATGTPPSGPPITPPPAPNTVSAVQTPKLTLVKSATPTSYSQVGDVINYTLVATNEGNVTLTGVSISDPTHGTLSCTPAQPATLAPGAKLTCTVSHTITQADLDAGEVDNAATATGTPPVGPPVTTPPSVVIVPALQAPHLSLTKSADRANYDTVGQVINYTLVATNDGNVTLHDVSISDPNLGALSCTVGGNPVTQPVTLAPGQALTCTGTHTVTQNDLDTGHYDNTAAASGIGPQGQPASDTASKSVPAAQTPHLSLTKSADPKTYDHVGQVINYTLVTTNDGNVTLTGVSISDPMFASLSCTPAQPATLAPLDTLTCTGTHSVTQADLDAGSIVNTANSSATSPSGPVHSLPATETVNALQAPHLSLTKSASPASYNAVGQVINYTLVATNDGNVTLSGVSISDPTVGTLTCTPTQPATLAPGASLTCTGTHSVTQADLDAGHLSNTANAAGKDPQGQPVASPPASVTVPAVQNPHLSLTKTANPTSYNAVGQVINYTLVATNDGNVTLSNVSISDPTVGALTCTPSQPTTLAPNATLTCTGSHTVTQADLDAGSISNTARASGTPPSGTPISSPEASVMVPAMQNPHLALTKSPSPATYDHVGQVVNYTLVATNDGNVTLSNVSISDPKLGALTCTPAQPATLAPGAKLTCTGSYTVTQADLDAGSVKNTASASGTGPQGQPATATANATVTAVQTPALSLTKSANPTIYSYPGQVINYTYVVKNTGNVTLSGPFNITDDKLGTFQCGTATSLAPGASLTCTKSYTIQASDLNATNNASITNHATATGKFGTTTVTSNQAQATINQVAPTAQIVPTNTTCQQFASSTAITSEDFFYNVKSGKISNISPGVMFYYSKITAPASSFTIQVKQSDLLGWKKLGVQQLILWDANCNKTSVTGTYNSSTGTVTFNATGLTAGAIYYISVKLDPGTLVGQAVPASKPTDVYTLVTYINGTQIIPSWDSINVKPK